ncbi:MAG: pyridoxal 5'-phosphate synthase glutaminase subunit PdxT [Chloroflexi bacterium]|nr:pyridoxal 5'-phosphate synthase glutaminase subunit PdxT [Chloroflexota bacterium]
MPTPTVGVLALQGGFAEHASMLEKLGAKTAIVRLSADLERIQGLVLPGGESTTISRLMSEYGLFAPIRNMAASGFPIMGTCAGLVMLSQLDSGTYPQTIGVMDVVVKRNAYGRQIDSFESDLDIPALGTKPFPGVFIRAPKVSSVGPAATVLSRLNNGNGVVAVRQGNLLGCSFHPELTSDTRLHSYFLQMITGP